MTLSDRIEVLGQLGDYLLDTHDDQLEALMHKADAENPWFTIDHQLFALKSIASQMLDRQKLSAWVNQYGVSETAHPTHSIGLVMAGNIPLVGFSDWLAVFASGQRAIVKLSDKDKTLLPYLVHLIGTWMPESRAYTHFTPADTPMTAFDAVIATGSNNTSRYFEAYFSKYPHIIRRNRTSVAVLNGQETETELHNLALDIYTYFGLGCRNVSKLYLPNDYDLEALCASLNTHAHFAEHNKYRNNFDYNVTLFILNKIPYYANPGLILREDPSLHSRISCVHFEYYTDIQQVTHHLTERLDDLQCVITSPGLLTEIATTRFGQSQIPSLSDYPDGVDVMHWIKSIKPLVSSES
jgi:hypothetical protein